MTIIGIDPGLSGAIAILDGNVVELFDVPSTKITKGKTSKTDYLPYEMAATLRRYWLPNGNVHVFIEKVHAMPGQGSVSMFRFGEGYGLWLGIIAACGYPVTKVTPQAWKKLIMAGMGDKDAARTRAQELFPEKMGELSRKKDIGRADALLIAEYGRRTLK